MDDNHEELHDEELSVEKQKLDTDDKASARSMQSATRSWVPPLLSIFLTVGFFGLLGLTCFHQIPVANAAMLNVMIGSLGAGWTSCVSYWFGSSHHSDRQSEMLYRSTMTQDDK